MRTKITIIAVIIALIAIGVAGWAGWKMFVEKQRAAAHRNAVSSAESKISELNKYLKSSESTIEKQSRSLDKAEQAIAEKAEQIKKQNRKLEKQITTISNIKEKPGNVSAEKSDDNREVPTPDCQECFDQYEKPLEISLKGRVIYSDDDCLDDNPGKMDVDQLAELICEPYKDAARDIAVESALPEQPKFLSFRQDNEVFGIVATDGVHAGYRHRVVRLGPVNIKPVAEVQFDPRDDSVMWFAGIEASFSIR